MPALHALTAMRVVEHRSDARRQIGPAGHREQERHRTDARAQPAREHHELIRVRESIACAHDHIVAGAFGLESETAPRDPDERIEPVGRRHGARETVNGPIAAAHVGQFVRERTCQIVAAPRARVDWENNDRTKPAERHRHRTPA